MRVPCLVLALALAGGSLLAACGGHNNGTPPDCREGCPDGTVCEQGACVVVCDPGHADCNDVPSDGCEADTMTDPATCGACDTPCAPGHATPACVDGACGIATCDDGFGDCDQRVDTGCEQDTAGDVAHCGGCDHACATGPHATPTCAEGACGMRCDEGFLDCDGEADTGCELDGATDHDNCGACDHACASNETCTAGACVPIACTAPLADCNDTASDGCETDTSTDAAHCGTCTNACEPGATCVAGTCTYGCRAEPDDPITGQKCPIEAPCTAYAQCGTQSGAPDTRYWYCSPTTHTCQYLPLTNGFTAAPGTCTGALVIRQLEHAPWDKRIVPPDGVDFRAATTLALEVTNTTATDLYLDQLPLTLELAGTNASRFDVSSIHLRQVGSISDYGDGNNATQFVCSSPTTPFGASNTFTLGTGATGGCGGSAFSRVRAGMSTRFIVNLTFASSATFISGRQYRLRIGGPLVGVRTRTSTTGASSASTACTLPAAGITGAYLIFRAP